MTPKGHFEINWPLLLGKKKNSFVCFLEESEDTKSHFEIIWPLATQIPCGVFSPSYLRKILSQTILLHFSFLVLVYAKYQGVFLNLPENPFFIRVNSKWGDLWKWALWKIFCVVDLGNVHKGRPTIIGHFGHTYLPMSDVFYTMPIYLSLIFAEIPTYPKIGRPLWTFHNGKCNEIGWDSFSMYHLG